MALSRGPVLARLEKGQHLWRAAREVQHARQGGVNRNRLHGHHGAGIGIRGKWIMFVRVITAGTGVPN